MPRTVSRAHVFSFTAFVCVWLAAACSTTQHDSPTQLLVVVNSDLQLGSELASVRLHVDEQLRQLPVGSADAGGVPSVPFSFGVAPPLGDATRSVTIMVEAVDPRGTVIAVSAARTGFVKGQTRLLRLDLERDCALDLLQCGTAQTCRAGACASLDIDVNTLPPIRPGHELDGISPLADTCAHGCTVDAGIALDAGDGAVHPPDASTPAPRCDLGLFADSTRAPTQWSDGTNCSVIDYSAEWGWNLPSGDSYLDAGLDYVSWAVSTRADVVAIGVTLLDGGLSAISVPPPNTQVAAQSPALDALLASSALQGDQTLQFVIEDPILDPAAFSEALLEMLARHRNAGLIRECRPAIVLADSFDAFQMLVMLRAALTTDPRWQPLRGVVHLGRKLYGPAIPGEIQDVADADLELVVFESFRANLFDAITYAESRGLKVAIDNMYDSRMSANLCGQTDALQALINTRRPAGLQILD